MAMATGCLHGSVDQRRDTVSFFASISTTSADVYEVHVDHAVAGRDASLRLAAERNVGDKLAGVGIDDGSIVRIAVEREDLIRRCVIYDGVGIFGGLRLAQDLERLEVEHQDGALVPGRRETMSGLRNDRGAMRAVDASHLAEQLAVVGVDDHEAILPADVKAVARRVRNHVVPGTVTAERVPVRDLILCIG